MAARDGAALKPVLSGLSMKPVPSGERLREARATAKTEGDDPAAVDVNLVLTFLAARDRDLNEARRPRLRLRAQRRGARPRGAASPTAATQRRRRHSRPAAAAAASPSGLLLNCRPASQKKRRGEKRERGGGEENGGERGRGSLGHADMWSSRGSYAYSTAK
uniref:Uncharacterized protein n=1 Tax=Oryza sativa subsp. japonica TaxID=39947 RepID=Q6K9F0_ORYSJ|nr:hypothetical protein [Oryza sativa Japonica Group]